MRILDLFCGAGGAAMGLHRAFPDAEIIGVDIQPQPRYPFKFVQGDALTFPLEGFDFIWASPPCQRFSSMGNWARDKEEHPDFINNVRLRLIKYNTPYVIENIPGSPLITPIMLCGSMFGLGVIRHRLFECSFPVTTNGLNCDHNGEFYTVLTKSCRPTTSMFAKSSVAKGRLAMGIDWMTQYEMGEAIPPAYSEYIGNEYNKSFKKDAAKSRRTP